jgi:hypothetical protein
LTVELLENQWFRLGARAGCFRGRFYFLNGLIPLAAELALFRNRSIV